jgi:pimeloyl-ACP methyl ester carboxylesterase
MHGIKYQMISIALIFICTDLNSQNYSTSKKMKIYLIPGQGSDSRLFDKLELDSAYTLVKITCPSPEKHSTMQEYAGLIAKQIDTTEKFSLIGVSLGGMICTELAEVLNPEKVIIVSSAKCRSELPFRYRILKKIPLNRIISPGLYWYGAQIAQPIVEPDRHHGKETFKSMLKSKDPIFLKRTTFMIINWNRTVFSEKIVHIHGNNDHTIPLKNVQADFIIENGSHMMMFTRGKEISTLINEILIKN